MEILAILIPVSLLLGGIGLGAFVWAMRTKQFEDPAGDANRIIIGQWDDAPAPAEQKPDQALVSHGANRV